MTDTSKTTDPRPAGAAASSSSSSSSSELDRLREENADLRERLALTGASLADTSPVDRLPSYERSEGERQELELTGYSTSPFDGKTRDESGAELDLEGIRKVRLERARATSSRNDAAGGAPSNADRGTRPAGKGTTRA